MVEPVPEGMLPQTLPGQFADALAHGLSYDPRRNPYIWFGLLWGMPIPFFVWILHDKIALPSTVLLLLMVHPLLFAVVFGAMGTMKRAKDLEVQGLIQQLESEVSHQGAQIDEMYWHSVKALAEAIESKDAYLHGHSDRVCWYATKIAKQLGLSGSRVRELQFAAMLHDIGKIHVPGKILHKPSSLTATEYAEMQSHPVWGERILSPIPHFDRVRRFVRQHHERCDGKGYPDGLRGEEICLESRILAVADTFDAMTSRRPYRDGLPEQVAIEELKRCSGMAFDGALLAQHGFLTRSSSELDPGAVEAFLAVLETERPAGRVTGRAAGDR